jgi:ubiquitin-activating enzyme E1 C
MYMGQEGLYTSSIPYARKAECAACQRPNLTVPVDPASTTLQDLIDLLKAKPSLQLANPSIMTAGKRLYMAKPEALRSATAANCPKTLVELGLQDRDELVVLDDVFPRDVSLALTLHFTSAS